MSEQVIAVIVERISLDELRSSCAVSREWVIEHVHAGVLAPVEAGCDPEQWLFPEQTVRRVRRLRAFERDFDANPESAGLLVDLLDEVERLRARLRRAGLPFD